MRERLFIDGIDAFEAWGAFILEGGWNELIAYPPLKPSRTNEWQEWDGIEVDLTAPRLAPRKASLRIGVRGKGADPFELLHHLLKPARHTFRSDLLNREWRLRLEAVSDFVTAGDCTVMTLSVVEDNPLPVAYRRPTRTERLGETLWIDDAPLSAFGARALQGTAEELLRYGTLRGWLTLEFAGIAGQTVDTTLAPSLKAREATIPILFRAGSMEELWQNYDALLFTLLQSGERTLYYSYVEEEYKVHYTSAKVVEFFPVSEPWLRIDLTLTIIDGGRAKNVGCVLGTEAGVAVEAGDSLIHI